MKAAPFEYVRPASVDEAVALLAEHGEEAKLIAGGQSLVPMMAMRLARPAWLVDINRLPALKFIEARAQAVAIGACSRQCDLERDAALASRMPLIGQALRWVGHVQTRNRGTVGGSLAHADPSAELPLVAQTLGARIQLRSAVGARTITAHEFFAGPMMTSIEPTELVASIEWPVWTEGRVGSAFEELGIREGDFAIVAACAQVALDTNGRCMRAALGLGGVDSTPLAFPDLAERLVGAPLEEETLRDIANQAAQLIEPGEDLHATRAYRRHLARTLGFRALHAAANRAKGLAASTSSRPS